MDLQVGEEQLLHFEQPVGVGLPSNLAQILRVQTIGNTVYLTARTSFPRQRILLRSKVDGSVIVLDLKATSEPVPTHEFYIRSSGNDGQSQANASRWNYVDLVRFAAQFVYAPARLKKSPSGITIDPTPSSLDGLVRGVSLHVEPIASWRTENGLYLLVARVTNRSVHPVELHPTMLRGNWLAAAFHHYRLLPEGSHADGTALYLVSDRSAPTVLGL